MIKAIILDAETTNKKNPEPIEIAYFGFGNNLQSLVSESEFHEFYKPTKPISLGALATHHIMDEDLVDCPPYNGFSVPEGVEYLVGHNIDFDWEVIGSPALMRICTLSLCRDLWPEADSHSLSAMLYLLERSTAREKLKNAHSAKADVEICREILVHIVDKLGVSTWEDLWKTSEKARIPKIMPFGKHQGQPIEKVPVDYLQWLVKQRDIDPYLLAAIKQYV